MNVPPDTVVLDAVRFASMVAPAITRTFAAGMRASGEEGRQLVQSYGGAPAGGLIDLRNPLAAGRSLAIEDVVKATRYIDAAIVRESLRSSVAAGLVEETPEGRIIATARGHEFLDAVNALHSRVLSERWPDYVVDRLNPVLARLLAEAGSTGGDAWALHAPPHEPAGTAPPVRLLNRLSTMRQHRSDAHAAAWREHGWTVAQITAMPWGSHWSAERSAIEDATNARAAAPYSVLSPDERLQLLADLAALI